jgi:hypothetical protein
MVEYKGIELIRTNSTIQKTRENQKNKNAKECCWIQLEIQRFKIQLSYIIMYTKQFFFFVSSYLGQHIFASIGHCRSNINPRYFVTS